MIITDRGAQKIKCVYVSCHMGMEGFKKLFLMKSFFSCLSARCGHAASRHNRQVSLCLWSDHMLVIDGSSCKSRLWLHSILSVLLQVLRLRKLRSGLHEEGRRADSAVGLTVYLSDVL